MIKRRPTPKSIVSMIIVAIVFCFIARTEFKNVLYVLHKKEAIGRVISFKVPDPQHATNYLVATKFFNEYKHDSADVDVWLKNYNEKVPGYIKLYYDDLNTVNANEPKATWGTIMWQSLVCLLLLSYILLELTSFTISNGRKK